MTELKIGDKVKVLEIGQGFQGRVMKFFNHYGWIGQVGTLTKIRNDDEFPYSVQLGKSIPLVSKIMKVSDKV